MHTSASIAASLQGAGASRARRCRRRGSGSGYDLGSSPTTRQAVRVADTPWQGDACALVDAFRRGERSPVEELDATLAAIRTSNLNAFSYVDVDGARAAAAAADVALPFGGVPTGIK